MFATSLLFTIHFIHNRKSLRDFSFLSLLFTSKSLYTVEKKNKLFSKFCKRNEWGGAARPDAHARSPEGVDTPTLTRHAHTSMHLFPDPMNVS